MTCYGLTTMRQVAEEIDYNVKNLERVLYRYGEDDLVRRLIPGRRSKEQISLQANPDRQARGQRAASRRLAREAALNQQEDDSTVGGIVESSQNRG